MWYLVTKSMTRALFGITTHITYQKPFWIWIRICVKIFFSFVTLSILHIETCMIPLSKAVHKGFISFSYTWELWAIYGDVMTQKLKKPLVFACDCAFSLHRIKCNKYTESFLWRASFLLPTLMSYEQYMRTLWPKSMKIWWLNRASCSLIHLICSKRLIFETMSWSTFVDLQG